MCVRDWPRNAVCTGNEWRLTRLAALDPSQSQIVELRFFAGLAMDEIAQVIGRSKPIVEREWRAARAWLGARLQRESRDDP
jgi:RNA polymerase sigma-70 factor, ECF subfamily